MSRARCARLAALALLAVAARAHPGPDPCLDGSLGNATITELVFANSTVVNSTLHLPGGQLRYDGTYT